MPTFDRARTTGALFDQIDWKDPVSGRDLEPVVAARTPAGVPICGALRIRGTDQGYPIVDCVARVTPELAVRHRDWLAMYDLRPPAVPDPGGAVSFQAEETVESFGFQWTWNSQMRSDADLVWRVARRFKIDPKQFADKLTLDAGAGAGDQSRWLLQQGAHVVSIDLSSAIDVVAAKLRNDRHWVGVQGDITALPFAGQQFDVVYCEGVIQHTRDSALTVRRLFEVLRPGGLLLATHYSLPTGLVGRLRRGLTGALRRRLCRWERYPLLLFSGVLAASAYVPVLGWIVRASGAVVYYDLMPDFKTTWTNTFDNYGNHAYQRYISAAEFRRCFECAGPFQTVHAEGTALAVRRTAPRSPALCEKAKGSNPQEVNP